MSDSQQIQSPPPYSPQLETPAPQSKNVLGLISMIVGIAAFVGAFIPVLNYITGIIAIAGIVLGVLALLKKDKPRKAALTGTITSSVALILSIVLAIVYTGAIMKAVEEAQGGISASETAPDAGTDAGTDDTVPSDDASDEAVEEPSGDEVGTRGNPAPLGTLVELSDRTGLQYEITLDTSTLNANEQVAAAYEYNDVAPEGLQYAMISVTAVYKGADSGTPSYDLDIEFVSAAGTTHTVNDAYVFGEPAPALSDINDLYPDATGTGNVVIAIPAADAANGTWVVSSFFGDSKFFYSAQ
ncbi:DUF4190 domain-containing protein [Cryobacterium frigoriphilum]|uniref:DUF4190 domain-containing protein n=1 Tax=Cryobacterium frigoriphilum TaxID=1259150 RepID=A0A4V3IR60_9MICO|nr:DUF4190 domain-containing protein [Cryobacterium frigoriphilum]TFD50228.1 DUF4190 domain-containing protein [Cryobacterium frigoriphilum]